MCAIYALVFYQYLYSIYLAYCIFITLFPLKVDYPLVSVYSYNLLVKWPWR